MDIRNLISLVAECIQTINHGGSLMVCEVAVMNSDIDQSVKEHFINILHVNADLYNKEHKLD